VTSDYNDPNPDLERAYQELLKLLPLRGNIEVAATRPFRPVAEFITALTPVQRVVLMHEDGLFRRCQRAVDRAQRLCETAEQLLRNSAIPPRPSQPTP
jgi:hypothetical protein